MSNVTWSLEQVRAVERLRTHLEVDDELLHRDPDGVRLAAESKAGKRLVEMGHPHGVEIHPGDLEAAWVRSDATPWKVTATMRWRPTTTAVELRGGPQDGQRWSVREVGQPLRLPTAQETPWFDEGATSESVVVEMTTTYELVGWREDDRVWVYAAN